IFRIGVSSNRTPTEQGRHMRRQRSLGLINNWRGVAAPVPFAGRRTAPHWIRSERGSQTTSLGSQSASSPLQFQPTKQPSQTDKNSAVQKGKATFYFEISIYRMPKTRLLLLLFLSR